MVLAPIFAGIGMCAHVALADDWDDCDALMRTRKVEAKLSNEEWLKLSNSVIRSCTKIIESSTESRDRRAEAYARRGGGYSYQKNVKQAIENFTKAVELNPKYAEGYISRAMTYARIGEHERAVTDFKKTIAVSPRPIWPYYFYFTNYLEEKGDWDGAIKVRTKMIEIWPTGLSYMWRGEIYMKAKDYKRAAADFRKAVGMQTPEAEPLLKDAERKLKR